MLRRTFGVLSVATAATVLAQVRPQATFAWLAKEGPVEHASHAVLAAAAIAWALIGGTRRERALTLAMAAFLLLVLAEEVDWGAVYGWLPLGERIDALLGHRNMHNAVRGASYQLFALPLVAYYMSPGTGSRWGRWWGRLRPSRDERAAFVAIAGLFTVANTFAAGAPAGAAQELLELLLYALLLANGARLWRARRAQAEGTAPSGSAASTPSSASTSDSLSASSPGARA